MSWPAISECVKDTDWSWYQHNPNVSGDPPLDVDQFVEENPEIDLYIIRGVWPNGVLDRHFRYYYDGFKDNGKMVGVYLWPNPTKSIPVTVDNWKRALDGRLPSLIVEDFELTWRQSPTTLTRNARESLAAGVLNWPSAKVIPYTRASWWDDHMLPGWESAWEFWLAHYPHLVYDKKRGEWRQVHSFAELDSFLPIHNRFTPYLGRTLTIGQVVGWQASEKGRMNAPIVWGLDFGYFKKDFIAQTFNGHEITLAVMDCTVLGVDSVHILTDNPSTVTVEQIHG